MTCEIKFCTLCVDYCETGDEPVYEATHLLHEVIDGNEEHTPVCGNHFEAARRYRLARGYPLNLPLSDRFGVHMMAVVELALDNLQARMGMLN